MVSCSNTPSTKTLAGGLSSPVRTARRPAVRANIALSCRGWCSRIKFMTEEPEEKSKAQRAMILLYALMAAGILLPFVLLWLKR
jgi:hypothetical protein